MNTNTEAYLGLTAEEWSWYFSFAAGHLVHNPNRPDHTFTSERHHRRYYNKYRGRLTTNTPDRHGYALVRIVPVDGPRIVGYRHMVVWLLHHGWLPPAGHKLMHIDGNKLNDIVENLAMYSPSNPSPNLLVSSC
jgi:hypothetical protein